MKRQKKILIDSFYLDGRFFSKVELHSWIYTSVAHTCARLIALEPFYVSQRFTLSGILVARSAIYQGL